MAASWFPEFTEGATVLDQVINLRPAYASALRDVEAAVWGQDVLEPEILELCRLRIEQLLGGNDDREVRARPVVSLDEPLVDELAHWPSSPAFTDRQRVCLGFAEQIVVDAQGVTDEQARQVIDAVGEGAFLVLSYGCGLFETTQRARALLTARAGE